MPHLGTVPQRLKPDISVAAIMQAWRPAPPRPRWRAARLPLRGLPSPG